VSVDVIEQSSESSAKEPKITRVLFFARNYATLILIVAMSIWLSIASPAFLTFTNILNIFNQNAPLLMIAIAGTLVIISGAFDLSTAAIFAVVSCAVAWLAVKTGEPALALICAPLIGLVLGVFNGLAVTLLRVHSFLATLATSLVYGAIAVLITGGSLIVVSAPSFATLGRGKWIGIFIAVYVFVLFFIIMTLVLNRTNFGRHVFAIGGNAEAAQLSGIRVARVRVIVFALSGLASGIAAAIGVSLVSSGQPQAGTGLQLSAIAAVILGGTSIYGGRGAVWRSVSGVILIALIGNGFDLLNFNPQIEDLVEGLIILAAVGLAAAGKRR
jgi:ribose transport system permease protein